MLWQSVALAAVSRTDTPAPPSPLPSNPGPHGRHYVRRAVRVHEHSDGRLSVFHGPRRLGRYGADGAPAAGA